MKNVVIEDMPEGVTGRWENGTVYLSSALDTAEAMRAKAAYEISHAAGEGDMAFAHDIIELMEKRGFGTETVLAEKQELYSRFFRELEEARHG